MLSDISGKTANRMKVISIYDLNRREASQAFARMRHKAGKPPITDHVFNDVFDYVGGRMALLNRVSKALNPIKAAGTVLQTEKAWLLGQIGLIPDCDDDVMDEVGCCLLLSSFWC